MRLRKVADEYCSDYDSCCSGSDTESSNGKVRVKSTKVATMRGLAQRATELQVSRARRHRILSVVCERHAAS